jgi:hypothetical protein
MPRLHWSVGKVYNLAMVSLEVAATIAALAPCLIGVAYVVAVVRAERRDIPAVVRALTRGGDSTEIDGADPRSPLR